MLKEKIAVSEINKIFDNKERKIEYLKLIHFKLGINEAIPRTISSINDEIVEPWNYETSKNIIREMFFHSQKFINSFKCKEKIDYLINDWHQHKLEEIEWPFSAMTFDSHVARINRLECSEEEKDDIIAINAIKFRRIKEINTCRNDYIEGLIIYHNDNIIPTFKHNRGVDFYINGKPFDQKVSRSVGNNFTDRYGYNYYKIAINHPELVAKSLYENQDEERFDADPRLYVVYLDNNVSSESIEKSIIDCNFHNPIEIEFEYKHSNSNFLTHRTYCYVLLLHN